MTVLNLMLGSGRGGLEQAAIDYAEALKLAGLPALTVTSPGAWAEAQLVAANVAHEALINNGRLDIFAPSRLRKLAKRIGATVVICHGNRAVWLALKALKGRTPIIAVAHNYSTRRFAKADACFSITQHLADHLKAGGAQHLHYMPNMVRLPEAIERPAFRAIPVIGSMGRMVAKKGFHTYIEALAILKSRDVQFRALLGGDGEESDAIDERIARYQLGDCVNRMGWVSDKAAFFASLDIFILPSLHEAFGIVLIEAMSCGLPVISSDAEGPREIITNGWDGILVRKNAPEMLAEKIIQLLDDPAYAKQLGEAAATTVHREFSMKAMAERLQTALTPYIKKHE